MSNFTALRKEWKDILDFFSNPALLGVVIGIVVGKSFGDMVTSLIDDVIYPCLDYFVVLNIDSKFIVIKKGKNYPYKSIEDAKKDGAAVISWGIFSKSIINFIIHGIAVYYVIKFVTHFQKLQKNIFKLNSNSCE